MRARSPSAGADRQRRGRRARAWGRWAERFAGWLLQLKGYRIVARNARTPLGEIDLVARLGGTLVLVEVKARPTGQEALSALGSSQRERIERAALWVLQQRPELQGLDLRCDVVIVSPWRRPHHVIDAWRS